MGSMVVVGVAIVAIATGVALAKSHGEHGKSGHDSHGHGKQHGKAHDDGGPAGVGDDGTKHGNGGGPGNSGGHGHGACDGVAASTIGAFVDVTCPCDGVDDGTGIVPWKNHGQYVRCVSHAVRDAARAAGVKRRCVKNLVPCAARSSCGKRNAVTCLVATTGTCTNGACSNDDDLACATDADCAVTACGVTSAARCDELGGTAGSGSCCTASPSGAFLD
jgi:hypothetical protein